MAGRNAQALRCGAEPAIIVKGGEAKAVGVGGGAGPAPFLFWRGTHGSTLDTRV